jgi:hypothetical protein
MATIQELMPYLEQGYIAADHVRMGPAYLHPQKQDGGLVFEWTAYQMESEWAKPAIHTQAAVCTWRSNNWGILYQDGGSELSTDEPERIKQVIAAGQALKADGFR